ncbi:S-layer homology domain-containing protein [Aminipila sp.]|uniref:S-layer homology domain-containing protein n=1 Tax=Aminipila sp. TaxID=2060095 RepID=UPI00289E734E|nr:S-layer homology domain-containing protein [Aminipila sp.]
MKRVTSFLILIALSVQLILPISVQADSSFTPHPRTAYAQTFISLCDGQQWFINEIERILNQEQKTLDTVTSNADFKNITSIGLKDAGITGRIPRAIGQLINLQNLFLSGNKLSGNIPSELFTLTKISNIDLTGNSYQNAIPSSFGTMPSLKVLSLSGNNFTGVIPNTILANTMISALDVSGNKLSGPIPATLNQMTSLTYLNLSDNGWTAGAMLDFSALTNLKTLSMWGCNMTGTIPPSVFTLTNLQILDLADNDFTGEIPTGISSLSKLQLLSLGRNYLEGTIPTSLDSLTSLSAIDLSNNRLRGVVSAQLATIHEVYMENNYLTGNVLKGIANNQGNFCDGVTTAQYQLIGSSPVRITSTSAVNVYPLLKNKLLTTGTTMGKPILNTKCYTASLLNDTSGKVTLTSDEKGIYVLANTLVPQSDNLQVVIMIKDNIGSDYSKVSMVLTTDEISSGGGGFGGGGGSVTTEPAVTHEPYVNGYEDGTFCPGNNVTREEIAKMIVTAFKKEAETTSAAAVAMNYTDVELGRWSYRYIQKTNDLSYLKGYEDKTFRPGRSMNRAELAACLVRIAESGGITAPEAKLAFSDVGVNEWYTEYVAKAVALGLVTGYEDNNFRPGKSVSRAEAVTMINRMMGRNPETCEALKTATNPYKDIDKSYWAYLQILEAGLMHQH